MRRLAPEECDSFSRADGHTHHRCTGTTDTARQIDREHRRAVAVDSLDHIVRLAGHWAVETRAEQRIDDQSGLADCLRIEGQHRVFPTLAADAASPCRLSPSKSRITETSRLRAANSAAATNPSPPLFPGPATTRIGPSAISSIAALATA